MKLDAFFVAHVLAIASVFVQLSQPEVSIGLRRFYGSLASKPRQLALDSRHDATLFHGISCFPSCDSKLSAIYVIAAMEEDKVGRLMNMRFESSKSVESQQLHPYNQPNTSKH